MGHNRIRADNAVLADARTNDAHILPDPASFSDHHGVLEPNGLKHYRHPNVLIGMKVIGDVNVVRRKHMVLDDDVTHGSNMVVVTEDAPGADEQTPRLTFWRLTVQPGATLHDCAITKANVFSPIDTKWRVQQHIPSTMAEAGSMNTCEPETTQFRQDSPHKTNHHLCFRSIVKNTSGLAKYGASSESVCSLNVHHSESASPAHSVASKRCRNGRQGTPAAIV
jgi:hypothetical protein